MEDLAKAISNFKRNNPDFEVVFSIKLKDSKTLEIEGIKTEVSPSLTTPEEKQSTPDSSAPVTGNEIPHYVQMTETVNDRWKMAHADDEPVPCEVCGEEFKQKDPKQRFCSLKCRELHQRPRIEQVDSNCEFCGETFTQTRRDNIYCSPKCISDARKIRLCEVPLKEIVRDCERCSKQFNPKHPMQTYCSKDCKYEADKQRSKDRWSKLKAEKSKVPKTCNRCGQTKTLVDFYGSGSVCITCKRKSSVEYKDKTRVCNSCGKKTTKLYCSEKCRKDHEALTAQTARILTDDLEDEKDTPPLERFARTNAVKLGIPKTVEVVRNTVEISEEERLEAERLAFAKRDGVPLSPNKGGRPRKDNGQIEVTKEEIAQAYANASAVYPEKIDPESWEAEAKNKNKSIADKWANK